METLQEYRHSIDSKIKKIFVESLKKAINKVDKKKFSFIGIIGSIKEDRSHDIDVLIFPAGNVKIGEAILEYAKLYDTTEKEIKKHHKRYYIVACQKFAMQELTIGLSAIQEGSAGMIPVHSMFFTNHRDFKRFSPKAFVKKVKQELLTLHGNWEDIKEIPELPQKKLEPYFFVLDFEMNSRIKTFPKHIIRASAEALFEYLQKKYHIKIKDKIPHNIAQINKEFIKLMHTLDEVTYS